MKKWLIVLALMMGTVYVFLETVEKKRKGDWLYLVACDVGQGDAFLVYRESTQILVDTGRGEKVLECLGRHMPLGDRKIELVMISHDDEDHDGAFEKVEARYEIGKVIRGEVKQGDLVRVGEIEMEILWPMAGKPLERGNEESTVAWLRWREFDVLFTGDIGEREEGEVLGEYDILGLEVLKVSHHGSRYSSSDLFIQSISPKLALIGVGKNSYGHPAEEVLDRLEKVVEIRVKRTDLDGEIVVVSDGNKFWLLED
jgi:competence protein ComEC